MGEMGDRRQGRRQSATWVLCASAALCVSVSRAAEVDAENPEDVIPGETLTPPELVSFFEATYPEAHREHAKEVVVVARLGLDETGSVTSVEIVSSGGPAFDANGEVIGVAVAGSVDRFRLGDHQLTIPHPGINFLVPIHQALPLLSFDERP